MSPNHYRVIQSLGSTIGAPPGLVARFDLFRKKRNLGGYERAGAISEEEARAMLSLARELAADVRRWLGANHPDLL